ncbi:MAG: response regulator [Alphaproteobacteria bacterium]|nr:response regulator [Alphaproteobacteria bacterium]
MRDLSEMAFLVIDDNAFARQTIAECLRRYNVTKIHEAKDALTGINIVNEDHIDVILVDIDMPGLTGIEFTRLIRHDDDRRIRETPILVVSGHPDDFNVKGALCAGINDFVIKPFSAETLYKHIVNVIEKPLPFVQDGDYSGPKRNLDCSGHDGKGEDPKP